MKRCDQTWQDAGRCYNISRRVDTKFKVVIDTTFLRFVRYDSVSRILYIKLKFVIDITFLWKMVDKVWPGVTFKQTFKQAGD